MYSYIIYYATMGMSFEDSMLSEVSYMQENMLCHSIVLKLQTEVSVLPGPTAVQSQINTQRLILIINYLTYCLGLLLTSSYNLTHNSYLCLATWLGTSSQ